MALKPTVSQEPMEPQPWVYAGRPVSAQCLQEGKQQCELTLDGLEAPWHLWQRQAKRRIAKFGGQQRESPGSPLYF